MSRFRSLLQRVIPASRNEREEGVTLIEMMAVVALIAIIGAPQINNFIIEREKSEAATAITTLNTLGTKLQEYCDDQQQQCAGVTEATLVTDGYIGQTVTPPEGGNYTITCANGAPSAVCTIKDPNNYNGPEVWGMGIHDAAGGAWSQPAVGSYEQLEYQNVAGGVTTQT